MPMQISELSSPETAFRFPRGGAILPATRPRLGEVCIHIARREAE